MDNASDNPDDNQPVELPGAFAIEPPQATSISWSASQNAASYDAVIATDAACVSEVQSFAGITSTSATYAPLADGAYYVCVTAKNVRGQTPASNNGLAFMVTPPPPAAGAFSVLTRATHEEAGRIRWSASQNAIAYSVAVSDNADCSSPIWSVSGVTGTQATAGTLPRGLHYVCVTAEAEGGNALAAAQVFAGLMVLGQREYAGPPPTLRKIDPQSVLATDDFVFVGDSSEGGRIVAFAAGNESYPAASFVLNGVGSQVNLEQIGAARAMATDGTHFVVADASNHRVLVWNGVPAASGPADFVLGQSSATTNIANQGGSVSAFNMNAPAGVAIADDKLFVADTSNHRVLVFDPFPTAPTGASYVLGQPTLTNGASGCSGGLSSPSHVATDGTRLAIADQANHRVLYYDTIPQSGSAVPDHILGQDDVHDACAARDPVSGFEAPSVVSMSSAGLAVVDASHHRTLLFSGEPVWPPTQVFGQSALGVTGNTGSPRGAFLSSSDLYVAEGVPSRVLRYVLPSSTPSRVFGRRTADKPYEDFELAYPGQAVSDGQMLVVPDYDLDRVLIWYTPPTTPGAEPDVILSGHNGAWTAGICDGRLLVSEYDNNRVIVWNTIPLQNDEPPDLVLGQADFSGVSANRGAVGPSGDTLAYPYYTACFGSSLAVVDSGNERVLLWSSFPTSSGQPADVVVGQSDFTAAVTSPQTMDFPCGVGFDSSGRMYVAEGGNRRIRVWDTIPTQNGAPADRVIGAATTTSEGPEGVVGPTTFTSASGIALPRDMVIVNDYSSSRVIGWSSLPASPDVPADFVLGQATFTEALRNRGSTLVTEYGFDSPDSLGADEHWIYIGDAPNDRLMMYPID